MSRSRVLLINPPYPYQLVTTTRDVHEAMERKPPLGILSIASYLRTDPQLDVRCLDMQSDGVSEEGLVSLIRESRPDVVGISVVSFKLSSAYRITQAVKAAGPLTHVCWGGPHLSIYPKESLHLSGVDSIILGDGEVPFMKLCAGLRAGKGAGGIEGIYTLANEPGEGQFRDYVHADLDALPAPDITLLPYQKYRAFLTNDLMSTAITSRGCPHRCIFCKLDVSRIRLLSIEKVVSLVESYLALGVKEIEFYDETFNINTKRVAQFASEIIRRKLRFKWSFRGRVDAVDLDMLRLAKKAGCQRIQYGVEAGTDRVLTVLRKGISVAQVRRCFELTNKAGIDTVAYFILGNPTETMDEMRQTVRLAREVAPTYIEFSIFNISPGTESYRMALEQGVIDRDYWREFAADPRRQMPILTWTRDHAYEKLDAFRKEALKSFYMRPGYILKRILRVRPREAARVFRMGFSLLRDITRSGKK
jgi:radical SAM superfamily enzyme YgiQ (UPF0313 family)